MSYTSMEDVEPDTDSGDYYDCVETNKPIFGGLSAWFSESVRNSLQQKWTENGGSVRYDGMAMYYFSEDAEDDDTKKLFHSDQYLCDCLAVFHASFIDAAVSAGSVQQVCIGDYVLPPSILYRAYKEADVGITFAWETWIRENGGHAASKTVGRRRGEQSKSGTLPVVVESVASATAVKSCFTVGTAKRRLTAPNCTTSPLPGEDNCSRRQSK